jgi:hypothetical protein
MLPYVLIPKLGAPLCIDSQAGSLWEPLWYPLCIDSQAGSLWEPPGASGEPLYVLIPKLGASGSLWEPLGASGSLREPLGASGPKMVKITSCLVFQFVVAEWAAEMVKFRKFTSGSLWEPLYVLIPKLGAFGSLYVTLYVLIPKLGASGASGSLWGTTLCINSQAGNLWEPLGPSGSLWEPLGASGSLWEPRGPKWSK